MKKIIFTFMFFTFLVESTFAGISVVGTLTRRKSVKPGEKYEGLIIIKNTGEYSCRVRIYQTDYLFYADGRNIYGGPGGDPRSNAKWLSLSPNELSIPSKNTASVHYSVKVPGSQVLKGSYWSAVMVEEIAVPNPKGMVDEKEKGKISLQTRIRYMVQIITNIDNTGVAKIEFLNKELIQKDRKRTLQIDVKNTGEIELSPSLWVQLYNRKGIEISRFESNRLRVYPDCSVRHEIDLTDAPKGRYKALVVLDNGDENVFGAQYDLRIR